MEVYENVLQSGEVRSAGGIFKNCVFKKGVDLSCQEITGPLVFESCVCHGGFNISGVTIKNGVGDPASGPLLKIKNVKVTGGVDMRGIHVHGAVSVISLDVDGGIQGGTLKGALCDMRKDDFDDEKYGDTNQRKIRTIMDLGDFTDLHCKGTVNFAGCYVEKDFRFVNARIGGTFRLAQWADSNSSNNLPHAHIGGMLDMHGANVDGDVYLQGVRVQGDAIFSNMVVLQTMILRPWLDDERGDAEVKRSDYSQNSLPGYPTIFEKGIRATRIVIHGALDISGVYIKEGVNLDFATVGTILGKVVYRGLKEVGSGHKKPAWRKLVPAISEVARHTVELIRIRESLDTGDTTEELDWQRIQKFSQREQNNLQRSDALGVNDLLESFAVWSFSNSEVGEDASGQTKFLHPLLRFYESKKSSDNDGSKLSENLNSWKPKIEAEGMFVDTFSVEDVTDELKQDDSFSCTHVGGGVSLRTATVKGDVEFTGAVLKGGLDFSGCTIDGSLICRVISSDETCKDVVSATKAEDINKLLPCVIGSLEESRGVEVSIAGENIQVGRYVSLSGAIITKGINFLAAEVAGLFSLDSIGPCRTMVGTALGPEERRYSLRLSAAKVGGNVTFVGSYLESGLSLENSKVVGDVIGFSDWFDHDKSNINYVLEWDDGVTHKGTDERRTFVGQGYWAKGEIASLQFNGLVVEGDLDLRGCFCVGGILAQSATLNGSLMLGGLSRPAATNDGEKHSKSKETYFTSFLGCGRDAESGEYSLFLNTSTVRGDVDLRGSILTSGVRISNATINGHFIALPYCSDEGGVTQMIERPLLGTSSGAGLSRGAEKDNYRIRISVNGTGVTLHGYFYARGCYFLSGVFVSSAKIGGVADFSPFPYRRTALNEEQIPTLIGLGSGPGGGGMGLRFVSTEINSIRLDGVDWRKGVFDKNEAEEPIVTLRGATVGGRIEMDEKPNVPGALTIDKGFAWYDFTSANCGRVIFNRDSESESAKDSQRTSKHILTTVLFGCSEFFFVLGVLCFVGLPIFMEWFGWNLTTLLLTMAIFAVVSVLSKWISTLALGSYKRQFDPLLGKAFDFRDTRIDSLHIDPKKDTTKAQGWLHCSGTGQSLYGWTGAFLAACIPLVIFLAFGKYFIPFAILSTVLFYVAFSMKLSWWWLISFGLGILAIGFYGFGWLSATLAVVLAASLLFFIYLLTRPYISNDYGVVLSRCLHDEAIFLAVERQYRAAGSHYEADCISLQWQRLQFLRTRTFNLRWIPDLTLHLLTGHGVRMLPMVCVMVYIALWGTLLFMQPGAVIKNPDYKASANGDQDLHPISDLVVSTMEYCKPIAHVEFMREIVGELLTVNAQKLRFNDALLLTMGYFWPISHVQSRSEWIASDKGINLSGKENSQEEDVGQNDLKLTYTNVASILSLLGWIWLPLLIQNLLKFIPRMKERRS